MGLTSRSTLPDGGIVYGNEPQNTSSLTAITSQCETFLNKNLLTGAAYGYDYSFNQPSQFKYSPSQWLWGKNPFGTLSSDEALINQDSGAHQVAWTALGHSDRAVADLRSLLNFQLEDGRIPQRVNWRESKSWYDPFNPMLYSTTEYNDLTQMPVLPYSLRSIYSATGDVGLLEEFVPNLLSTSSGGEQFETSTGQGLSRSYIHGSLALT